MSNRKLTIYPNDVIYENIERLADEERRSLNQMTLLLLEAALTERGEWAGSLAQQPARGGKEADLRREESDTQEPRSASAAAGVPHLQTQPEPTPDREQAHRRCPFAFKHHNNHRGNPCPRCGFPE